jgi:adenylyltransferase/sulfurtransferase
VTDDGHADRCDPEWEITPRAVARMREGSEPFVLLDCRTPEEAAICHIEGGVLVPFMDLGLRLSDLREYEETPIVVYCHIGRRSLVVAALLREQGFDNVRSMAGGIQRWSEEVDPSVPTY